MAKHVIYLFLVQLSFFFAKGQVEYLKIENYIDSSWFNQPRIEQPGFGIMILENDSLIYSNSIGSLNIKKNIPISLDSKMAIASLSKQFTAAIILILEHNKLLSLEDDIRDYVPELPVYKETVRIKHLLSHTSGIHDHIEMMAIEKKQFRKYYSFEGTLKKLQQFDGLMFSPGTDFAYSNTGYILLAIAAERASGKTFEKLAKELIFEPLEMNDSEFSFLRKEKEYNYSTAYRYNKKKEFKALQKEEVNALGATGIYTSINDFRKWDNQIKTNVLNWPKHIYDVLFQTYSLKDGRDTHYNYGLKHRNFRGVPIIEHAGGWAFYNSQYTYIPSLNLSIIVFSNNEYDYSIGIVEKILEQIIPDTLDQLAAEENYNFPFLEGTYYCYHGVIRMVEYSEGWLKIKGTRMIKGKEQLYVPDDNLCFVANYSLPLCFSIPKMNGAFLITAETVYFQLERTYQKWEDLEIDISEIKGKYTSNEFPKAKIKQKGADLILKIGRRKDILKVYKNGLYSFNYDGYCLAFNSKGFRISNKRIINIEFTKVN